MKKNNLFLTCEHAANFIPSEYKNAFQPQKSVSGSWGIKKTKDILSGHWGWDIGALSLAKFLEKKLKVPLSVFPVSRLLIGGNRYRRSSFFSVFSKNLSEADKNLLIKKYWQPHADEILSLIKAKKKNGRALHMAIHSFTPVYKGVERRGDIGILFDPRRADEKSFAHKLQVSLRQELPDFIIRRNYPYSGVSEGLVVYFRKIFSPSQYASVELEINNKHLLNKNKKQEELFGKIAQALKNSI